MKTSITISFPENKKLKDILIVEGLKFQGNYLMLDVNKKENDSQTCLADIKYHQIRDIKLVSININNQNIMDHLQTVILSGYYKTKDNGYVPCLVEYKIRNLE